ncbi:amidohydrolase (plasmid) [Ketogulonicigenium robustum]|uniref:Amidohydrolase n=1 Tax=Ketogulonicigenium robustum TaxID=92947 RepID=A0A1W6P3V8_9RHOB|nr:amidohydrolase family protein [Ketogulonicigenium robustum]ARO16017.1 amidohydrolase [Ketogulonicigenium robustum]
MITLFKNAAIVDGTQDHPSAPTDILLAEGLIQQIGPNLTAPAQAQIVDVTGKTLMPGLIDAHVHVVAAEADLKLNAALPDAIVMVRALNIMNAMLLRGFTTVRDLGGATGTLVKAASYSPLPVPRLNVPGNALSQTGGHTDQRGAYDVHPMPATYIPLGSLGRVVDGVPEVRRACREEIKGGANFIKIMANGGVSSPSDPIHFLGFSREEILACVEEAANAGTYVAAHLYTDAAIRRAVECGVHSLEHCNLIEPETAKFAADHGCIAVPTLVTYDKLSSEGPDVGLPPASIAKIDSVRLKGMESLKIMHDAGLPMAYGSDLLGEMHRHQSGEFELRGQVLPAATVIASATHIAARLLRMEGQIGCIREGAFADIILVDGNPLADLSLLSGQGDHITHIMQGGVFVKS